MRDHHPHAATASAIDIDVLRLHVPDSCRTRAAKGGTAHCVVRECSSLELNRQGRTSCGERSVPNNDDANTPTKNRCQALFFIPHGGCHLSPWEDLWHRYIIPIKRME